MINIQKAKISFKTYEILFNSKKYSKLVEYFPDTMDHIEENKRFYLYNMVIISCTNLNLIEKKICYLIDILNININLVHYISLLTNIKKYITPEIINKKKKILENNHSLFDLINVLSLNFNSIVHPDLSIIDNELNNLKIHNYNNLEKLIENIKNTLIGNFKKESNNYLEDKIPKWYFYLCFVPFYLSYSGINVKDFNVFSSNFVRKYLPIINYTAPHCSRKSLNKRIKIGFFGKDIRRVHSVFKDRHLTMFNLNQEKFDTHIITYDEPNEQVKKIYERFKNNYTHHVINISDFFINWENVFKLMINQISNLELDVLVFPEIGMHVTTYLLAHCRFAPIQINTWGHSKTSGIDTIDYYFSSKYYEIEDAQKHYSEKLIKMDSLCTCYPDLKIPINKLNETFNDIILPKDKKILFCIQSEYKININFIKLLNKILSKIDNVILLLKFYEKQEKLFKKYMSTINYKKVKLLEHMEWGKFLFYMNQSDIVLDPYPFGICNGSLEAFSLGKCVVTLPSEYLSGRFTYGFYKKMGITDLIVNSKDAYIEKVVELLNNDEKRYNLEQMILSKKSLLFLEEKSILDWEDKISKIYNEKQNGRTYEEQYESINDENNKDENSIDDNYKNENSINENNKDENNKDENNKDENNKDENNKDENNKDENNKNYFIDKNKKNIVNFLKNLIPVNKQIVYIYNDDLFNLENASILYGEMNIFKVLNLKLNYICSNKTFDNIKFKKEIGDNGLIIFQGGDNFNDIDSFHNFRLKIMEDYSDSEFIQLPQKIFFSNQNVFSKSIEIIKKIKNIVIFGRDMESYNFLNNNFVLDNTKILITYDFSLYIQNIKINQKKIFNRIILKNTNEDNFDEILENNIGKNNKLINYDYYHENILILRSKIYYNQEKNIGFTDWKFIEIMNRDYYDNLSLSNKAYILIQEGMSRLSTGEIIETDEINAFKYSLLLKKQVILSDNVNINTDLHGLYNHVSENKNKYVLCRTFNGFHDMFCQILRCYQYCLQTGRILLIDTEVNWQGSINFNFSKYFDFNDKNIIYDTIEVKKILNSRDFTVYKDLNNYITDNYEIFRSGYDRFGEVVSDLKTGIELRFDFDKHYNCDILLYYQGGSSSNMGGNLFKMLKLNNKILINIKEKYNLIKKPYISIYVRNTDYKTNYIKLYNENKEIIENSKNNIYLATDSKEVFNFFKSKNKNIYNFTTFPESYGELNNLHNSDLDKDIIINNAFTDIILLALSEKIITNSNFSGFYSLSNYLFKNKNDKTLLNGLLDDILTKNNTNEVKKNKTVFLTFATEDTPFYDAGVRLLKQSRETNLFDLMILKTDKTLKKTNDFWNIHRDFIEKNKNKGFGYYIWKPYIILKQMLELNDGDILLYSDAGCEINMNKIYLLKDYFDLVKKDYIIGTESSNDSNSFWFGLEARWNKIDLIDKFDFNNKDQILYSLQRQAGLVMYLVCDKTKDFVKEWYKLASNYHLIDDTPSKKEESSIFVEHRHDQAIFSLLTKKYNLFSKKTMLDCMIVQGNSYKEIYKSINNKKKKKDTIIVI